MKKNTTYTAEDFANAEIARHPDGAVASRFGYLSQRQWRTVNDWLSDADMADQGWAPVQETADQPITLDALRDAWETAEVADECNEGDILIRLHPEIPTALVQVWRSEMTVPMGSLTRILRRAQKREPWQDLADVLGTDNGELIGEHHTITEVAKALHERGVRVTGGGDG